ncbi:unnamed protein product [Phytophthora lilii]|uniref:Unnamed protein product n=1 Tax=Phytophthora lilii TaxID=2077276 RepID=A0A9W6TRK9_9STRA|nr:unnamed protein product [Phytophthora lilii]
MFTDGVSLPGLSKKVMYQTCFGNLQYPDKNQLTHSNFQLTDWVDTRVRICVKCNIGRKDMSPKGFRYKKLLEFNSDRLVYSIDKEEKDIYAKMKANIADGPSIIFNRYAKRNETKIRGGKLCKKVIGYDANALYLWLSVMTCHADDLQLSKLIQRLLRTSRTIRFSAFSSVISYTRTLEAVFW